MYYLPLTGGTLTGNLTVQGRVTGSDIVKVLKNTKNFSYFGLQRGNAFYFMRAGGGKNNIDFGTSENNFNGGCSLHHEDFGETGKWYGIITSRTIGQQTVGISRVLYGCTVHWFDSGASFTLPAYGTWRYSCFATGDGWGFIGEGAGGSKVTNNSGHTAGGMFIRIA